MDDSGVSLHFERPPNVIGYYPRALVGRRLAVLPDGLSVPRIEASVEQLVVQAGSLRRFREVCGFQADGQLPVAYPHALALPLHVALLTHPAFVVRLMGLVHVANVIEWLRPLPESSRYRVHTWVEGHEETDRGQEFGLHTEVEDRDGVAWRECCTLLARRKTSGSQAARSARASLRAPRPSAGMAARETMFGADQGLIRRYSLVSGDLNPIHLSDFSARWYGFERAVAHGMWSMARSLAALGPELTSSPCRIAVDFKLPLFLPAKVKLHDWHDQDRWQFVLRDVESDRPHLAGTVVRT